MERNNQFDIKIRLIIITIFFFTSSISLLVYLIYQTVRFFTFYSLNNSMITLLHLDNYFSMSRAQLNAFINPFFIAVYLIGISFIILPILIVNTKKEFFQITRIFAIIGWLTYTIFLCIYNQIIFFFYMRNSLAENTHLNIILPIELFFSLSLIFTGIAYDNSNSKNYLSYFLYVLAGLSFVFFLLRMSIQWEINFQSFLVKAEYWSELSIVFFLIITLEIITIKNIFLIIKQKK